MQALPLVLLLCFGSCLGEGEIYNITIGDVSPDSQEIGSSVSTSVIAADMRVPFDGVLKRFLVRIGSTKLDTEIHLQAWRYQSGNKYKLTRTKQLRDPLPGVNEMKVDWPINANDILGLSCNGYCPVMRAAFDPDFRSKVSMSDRPVTFTKYLTKDFSDPDLMAQIAMEALLEVNGPLPVETTKPVTTPKVTSTSTASLGSSKDGVKETTLKPIESPQGQVDETTSIGLWWLLIAAVVVIVLLAIALVLVGACSWKRERNTLKKQLLSRPVSIVSESGRPLSVELAGSAYNSLPRQGLQSINAIEVQNEQRSPPNPTGASRPRPRPADDVLISPTSVSRGPSFREPTVVFDNGVTNLDSGASTSGLPPPPPVTRHSH